VTDLSRRLNRLEASGKGGTCPECGYGAGEPFEPDEVLWHDEEDAAAVEPEWCGSCGSQLVYVIGWRDIGPDEAGGVSA
jgi:hypothetical protein